jgi:REP element-mobilizing transposase RayT
MTRAWNDWYHCNGNTYGTWLHGDPRGFREKKHRRQIEGNYKKPPPADSYEKLRLHAKSLMKNPAVFLEQFARRIVCQAMVQELLSQQIELLALCVDDHHFHLLARFPDHQPRHWIGKAKRRASLAMQGYKKGERLWALKFRALPVNDRRHQINVFEYILRHKQQGAVVWTFRELPAKEKSPRKIPGAL